MAISEKVKEKIDDASQELKEAIDNLAVEVNELSEKVKEKLKGPGQDFKEGAEELKKEVRALTEKVRELVPRKRKRVPLRREESLERDIEAWGEPFKELRRASDRFFEAVLRTVWHWPRWVEPHEFLRYRGLLSWPRVDVSETEDAVEIVAELPGVEKEDIQVHLSEEWVTIKGERRQEEEEKEKDYYRAERLYGSFRRTLPIPCEVETEKAEATFKNGILRIHLPKSAAARERSRKIEINAA